MTPHREAASFEESTPANNSFLAYNNVKLWYYSLWYWNLFSSLSAFAKIALEEV